MSFGKYPYPLKLVKVIYLSYLYEFCNFGDKRGIQTLLILFVSS